VEVVPTRGGGATRAEILIQAPAVTAIPAQVHGPVRPGVLPLGALAMAVDLAWGRLAQVDRGLAGEMVGTER
jgi:hypothetical protein